MALFFQRNEMIKIDDLKEQGISFFSQDGNGEITLILLLVIIINIHFVDIEITSVVIENG